MVWFLDILKEDLATLLVLQLRHFLSMFPLMRLVKKILGKILESHIILVKVARHGQVDIGSVELQVDLAVDGGFQVLVVVLAHLGSGLGRCHGGQLRRGSCAALERWWGSWDVQGPWEEVAEGWIWAVGWDGWTPVLSKHCWSRKPWPLCKDYPKCLFSYCLVLRVF